MTLDEIQAEWDKDVEIDRTEIANEALKISKLHSKYWKMLSAERLLYKKYSEDMAALKLQANEFYGGNHTKEMVDEGWKIPARGTILKGDMPLWVAADQHLIDQNLRLAYQGEKVEFLKAIVDSLIGRGYQLSTALQFIKFTNGV